MSTGLLNAPAGSLTPASSAPSLPTASEAQAAVRERQERSNNIATQAQMQTAMRQLQPVPKKGPRLQLAAIRSRHNIQVALELHREYTPPHFEEMEPVYFRKVGGGDERVAFVLYENNKHFALYVLKENHLPEVIRSASYFDPEDEAGSDPKGPHNTANGVFRRSGMGLLFANLKAQMAQLRETNDRMALSAVENAEKVDALTKRITELEDLVKS